MNVWPSRPLPVPAAAWPAIAAARTLAVFSYRALCALAGVAPGISGADLDRHIHIFGAGPNIRPVGLPDALGIALPDFHGLPGDALSALEILAYGFLDYAARETVHGRGLFLPVKGRGRKAGGKALSGAERMRRWRGKSAITATR